MKNINKIFAFTVLAVFLGMMVSCGINDKADAVEIVGVWDREYIQDGETCVDELTLNEDGSFGWETPDTMVYVGQWSISKSKLILKGGYNATFKYKISKTSLKLTETFHGKVYNWKRVSK